MTKQVETIKINYAIAEHVEEKDTVMIKFSGTGIDLANEDHKHFMNILADVFASQMYAKANNILMEEIKFVKAEKPIIIKS